MVQRIGGFRRKTRHKLKKALKTKGKLTVTQYLKTFENGDRVVLKAEPSLMKGMYFPRFHGKCGLVTGKRGLCYSVDIKDGEVKKTVIVHPVHLKKVN